MHEIVKAGHFTLEIASRGLGQEFLCLLLYCRDSGSFPSSDEIFFRKFFSVLEQVFYKGKVSFFYPNFFSKNWITVNHFDGDRLEATFVFPTDGNGSGLTARNVMRLKEQQPDTVIEVHTTVVTVGGRHDFYLDISDRGTRFHEMIGLKGVSECRAALKKILNGECDLTEVYTNPDPSWIDALHKANFLNEFNDPDRNFSKSDPRDLKNVARIMEVIAAGSIPGQRGFMPKVSTRSYRVLDSGRHEIVQTAAFSLRNDNGKNTFDPIAIITVSRTIRETDEHGKTLGGRRKWTARPPTGTPRKNRSAIDVKITFERAEHDHWPPEERESNDQFSVRDVRTKVLAEYLRKNCMCEHAASGILYAITKGVKVIVPLADQWERLFYMENLVTMRKKIEKLLDLICAIAGGQPPVYFPLAFVPFPKRVISGGSIIRGMNEVPNKYIEITFEDKKSPFEYNLALKIEVSLVNDEVDHGGMISSSNTAVLKRDEVRDILFLGSKQPGNACVMQTF
jgi:hypothetical protein